MQNENMGQMPAPQQPNLPRPIPKPAPPQTPKNRSNLKWLMVIATILIISAVAGVLLWKPAHPPTKLVVISKPNSTSTSATSTIEPTGTVQLNPTKNYGNIYANGVVPVGDGKYTTNQAKTGYIFACSGYANNISQQAGGASRRGPWFVNNNTGYNLNQKVHVQGSVNWPASSSNKIAGDTRTIITNGLPNHPTGTFPISSSDLAYVYDRNPNTIKAQSLTYSLPANPTYSSTPQCETGSVGVMLTGVALFNGFDAGGRDAGAWEVQDSCGGHPESNGLYHYHTLSSCIKDTSVKTVIGFALDGFPITGPQLATNNILTTQDLDECHGITSQINLDGKSVTMYHYVMTQDFPYSVSCFRGTPINSPDQNQGGPPHQP